MGKLSSEGFSINNLETIKNNLQNIFIEALGNEFILDDNSPQGVIINRIAQLAYNNDLDGLNAYLQMNVNTATGINLDAIAFLRGTKRKEGTKKQITCEFTSTRQPISLFAGSSFTSLTDGTEYVLNSDTTIINPTQNITLVAKEKGSDAVLTGTLFQSVTYIPYLTNIEVKAYVDAINTETDAELRKRIKNMTDDFKNTVNAVLSQLLTLTGVTKVEYLQHEDDEDVPVNSTEFMVVGGDEQEIATTILDYKCPTSLTSGNTEVIVPNYYGRQRTVNFTRPEMCNIKVAATIRKKEEQITIDVTNNDEIKERIVDYINEQSIGTDVSFTTIFGIFAGYNAFDIDSLTLQNGEEDPASANIELDNRQYGHITTDDIEITVI